MTKESDFASGATASPSIAWLHSFEAWWSSRGQYIDPDSEDVSWHDKRKGLAERAYLAAMARSRSYVADHAVTPKHFTFANGRQVSMGKKCLLISDGKPEQNQENPEPTTSVGET